MKKFITVKLAGNLLLIVLVMLVIFHILILLKIIPPGIVWGGQANGSPGRLFYLELISLIVTLLFIVIVAVKLNYLRLPRLRKAANIGLWVMFVYFILNTIGNLASDVTMEKVVFTPITLILAILAFRLAIEKEHDNH